MLVCVLEGHDGVPLAVLCVVVKVVVVMREGRVWVGDELWCWG